MTTGRLPLAGAVLGAAGLTGSLLLAFVGPCHPDYGLETPLGPWWNTVFALSAVALGGAGGALVLHFVRATSLANRVIGGVVSLVAFGLVAAFLVFVLHANVCEGVRLDRF